MADEKGALSMVVRVVDQATAPIRGITEHLKQIGKEVKHLGHASGIAGIAEGFKGVGEGAHKVLENVKDLGEKFLEMDVIGAAALYELVKGAIETGAKLTEMAQRVGLGVDAYSQLQFAAGQAHVSAEEFNSAMDKFNVSLGEAKANSGPLYEFLRKVSPVLAEQVKHAKNTESALQLMSKAFEKVTDPSKRAALAQAAFGKSARQMGAFLGQGSEAIHAQMERYAQLAGSQQEFADRSEEGEKALNEFGAALGGARNAVAAGLMPALSELAKTAAEFVSSHRADLAAWAERVGKSISAWVEGGGVTRVIAAIGNFATGVGRVVDALGGWQNVAIGVGAIMAGPLLSSLVSVGSAVFSLVPAVASLVTTLAGAAVAFAPVILAAAPFIAAAAGIAAAGYEIYKNWDDLKLIFKETWQSITEYAQHAWDKMSPIFDALKSAFQVVAHPLDSISNGVGSLLGSGSQASPALAPGAAAGGKGDAPPPQTARVQVDFTNLPKGARVNPDRDNSADLDLSMGYNTLVGAQ